MGDGRFITHRDGHVVLWHQIDRFDHVTLDAGMIHRLAQVADLAFMVAHSKSGGRALAGDEQ